MTPQIICQTPPPPTSYIAWDTETYRIELGKLTPKLVCVQYQVREEGSAQPPVVLLAEQGANFIRRVLLETDIALVTHNGFYDYAVLLAHYGWDPVLHAAVVDGFRNGRLRDTLIRAKLHAIANGWLDFDPAMGMPARFGLAHLAAKYCGAKVEGKYGEDSWRLRYAELDGVPVEQWPFEALEYARLDPVYTGDVWDAIDYDSPDECMQSEKAWWMHLASVVGLYTDKDKVKELEDRILPAIEQGIKELEALGVYRPGTRTIDRKKIKDIYGLQDTTVTTLKKAGLPPLTDPFWEGQDVWNEKPGSKNMEVLRAIVSQHYNGNPPLTDKGAVSTARKHIVEIPALRVLADIGEFQKVKSTYLPVLKQPVVNPRGNPLVASGRVSYSSPNIANQPRLAGVRECWRGPWGEWVPGVEQPPERYLLLSADFAQAELCSLAQVCIDMFGYSRMAELINDSVDLHLYFVSKMRNIPYKELVERKKEDQVKIWRQSAKAANFGFPGGLGILKFLEYARTSYGIELTEQEARDMKAAWLVAYPEMRHYFQWMSDKLAYSEYTSVQQHRSGRIRGHVGYTEGLNTMFQGLTADGASLAINKVNREAWLDSSSPAFGVRMIGFFYDEFFGAVPDRGPEANHWACLRVCALLEESMRVFTPDVAARVEPALMLRWHKKAEPVYNEDGFLVPWDLAGM